jgi:hypothetical protein
MTNGRASCRALANSRISTLSGAEPARLGSLVAAALAIIRVIQGVFAKRYWPWLCAVSESESSHAACAPEAQKRPL